MVIYKKHSVYGFIPIAGIVGFRVFPFVHDTMELPKENLTHVYYVLMIILSIYIIMAILYFIE